MGYQALANAVIEQAAKDYIRAIRFQRFHPKDEPIRKEIQKLVEFFYSDWFGIMTDVDPDYLIGKMRKKVSS